MYPNTFVDMLSNQTFLSVLSLSFCQIPFTFKPPCRAVEQIFIIMVITGWTAVWNVRSLMLSRVSCPGNGQHCVVRVLVMPDLLRNWHVYTQSGWWLSNLFSGMASVSCSYLFYFFKYCITFLPLQICIFFLKTVYGKGFLQPKGLRPPYNIIRYAIF